jgi:hypothetical protein
MLLIRNLLKILLSTLFLLASDLILGKSYVDPPHYLTRNYKLNKNYLKDLQQSSGGIFNQFGQRKKINPLKKEETVYLYFSKPSSHPKMVNPEYILPEYRIEYSIFQRKRIIKLVENK